MGCPSRSGLCIRGEPECASLSLHEYNDLLRARLVRAIVQAFGRPAWVLTVQCVRGHSSGANFLVALVVARMIWGELIETSWGLMIRRPGPYGAFLKCLARVTSLLPRGFSAAILLTAP